MDETTTPYLLRPAHVQAIAEIWNTTPTVGLPAGGFGKKPDTVEDVIEMITVMSETLGRVIRERDEVIKQARDLEFEIETGGKLLRRMLGTTEERSAREALKAVQAELVGVTGFNAADVQQLARQYGVEL